jgi:hypothetical protein
MVASLFCSWVTVGPPLPGANVPLDLSAPPPEAPAVPAEFVPGVELVALPAPLVEPELDAGPDEFAVPNAFVPGGVGTFAELGASVPTPVTRSRLIFAICHLPARTPKTGLCMYPYRLAAAPSEISSKSRLFRPRGEQTSPRFLGSRVFLTAQSEIIETPLKFDPPWQMQGSTWMCWRETTFT